MSIANQHAGDSSDGGRERVNAGASLLTMTALPRSKLGPHERLHRRGLWEARNLHGAARAGSGYAGVGVCRERSVEKLDAFKGRITVIPGATNDREVIKRAVAGCDGVLVVLAPMRVHHYASGTAQAGLDYADPGPPTSTMRRYSRPSVKVKIVTGAGVPPTAR
jgi:hypothetical protein